MGENPKGHPPGLILGHLIVTLQHFEECVAKEYFLVQLKNDYVLNVDTFLGSIYADESKSSPLVGMPHGLDQTKCRETAMRWNADMLARTQQ